MKKYFSLLTLLSLCLTLTSARAQFGAQGGGSPMDEALAKVFGTNLNFSATVQTDVQISPTKTISIPGKIYFANGNSRTEMDMTTMTGIPLPPAAITQIKAMGMDKMVSISLISQKTVYMIYPNLSAYAKMQLDAAKPGETNGSVVTADLGKETLDGHPCVKKQYTISDTKTSEPMVMTTWNATDLKDTPIKIEQSSPANITTMHFTSINLTKPEANLFTPPTGFKAYDNVKTMMQTEMMKKMGSGMGGGMPAGK
ncbi:MAG TPA: hypothetical protein VGO57_00370 [Verrucomicrobiae bacterium]